ncbi:small membrane protein YdgU [Yersinia rochesterensis]
MSLQQLNSPNTRFSGCFLSGVLIMLRRYLFEITLTTLIICGLITLFFYL